MTAISSLLGLYAGGCVSAMIFFCTGRWPAVLERDWHWPVIFLWPLLVLWPLRGLLCPGKENAGINRAATGVLDEKRK